MKHKKKIQNSCHFHHGYEQQQHNMAEAGQFHEHSVFASGDTDVIAILIAIDAEQAL
jgi:hypothetical protein